jgi:hypothetical protein
VCFSVFLFYRYLLKRFCTFLLLLWSAGDVVIVVDLMLIFFVIDGFDGAAGQNGLLRADKRLVWPRGVEIGDSTAVGVRVIRICLLVTDGWATVEIQNFKC